MLIRRVENFLHNPSKVLEVLIPLLTHLLRVRLPVRGLRFVLVEIPRVRRASQMRHNRSVDLSVIQLVPVDVAEPGVRFDGGSAALYVAEPLRRVDCAEARDEVAGFGRHGGGIADLALNDPVKNEYIAAVCTAGYLTVRISS